MTERFQVKLSALEVCVLAALLGYESVFGIGEPPYDNENFDLKKQIKQTVKQLEGKKLLRYDLDGTLFLKVGLSDALHCVCEAETVACFSTNVKTGKKTAVYLLSRSDVAVVLEQTADGRYGITLQDGFSLDDVIPEEVFGAQSSSFSEQIPFDVAVSVKRSLQSFGGDAGKEVLNTYLSSPESVDTVSEILSGNGRFFSTRVYKKDGLLYRPVLDSLTVCTPSGTVRVQLDGEEYLFFETFHLSTFSEQLREILFSQKKGECFYG